jgi:hypothetical protein
MSDLYFCLRYVAVQIGVKIASVVQPANNHDGKKEVLVI